MKKYNLSKKGKWIIPATAGLLVACNPEKPEGSEPDLSDISFDFKPNIVWFSIEDISCQLAAYGDSTAYTPTINRMADEGMVFDNAYTVAGVCSPSRSSIITGRYPTELGTNNHRTIGIKPPENLKPFPRFLREHGYYCSNNWKEDYNFTASDSVWDDSSVDAHYKNRKPGQPFFSVYNLGITHQSMMWLMKWTQLLTHPDTVPVPPYYPANNEKVKLDVARNYSNTRVMDFMMKTVLDELESDGLLDSTIIVVWSDHGGPLPRQKCEILHSGTKVPLIIRFPGGKYSGKRTSDLVSLMDLGPTMMSLAGIDKPKEMDGKIFIGSGKEEREYSFAAVDRLGEYYDIVRSITDGRYRYIRNYFPSRPMNQPLFYGFHMDMHKELYDLNKKGELVGPQKLWFSRTKPIEELYDTSVDTFEISDVASDPAYAGVLEKMRNVYLQWQQNTYDMHFIPEQEIINIQELKKISINDFINKNPDYYYKVIDVANKSLYPDENIDFLIESLKDTIPSVRFWAVKGIGNLQRDQQLYYPNLVKLKYDHSDVVRACVAWTLCKIGYENEGISMFRDLFYNGKRFAKGIAVNFAGDLLPLTSILEKEFEYVRENASYPASAATDIIFYTMEE